MLVMAAAASALLSETRLVHATSTYQGPSGTTSAPITGDWNTAGNWSPSGVPASSSTTTLSFGGTTTYTSTDDISGAFSLNSLLLSATNANITAATNDSISFGGTTPTITQSTAGTVSISAPVAFSAATAISQITGGTINLSGVVSGSALTLNNSSGSGNSVVNFTGQNTFSGLQVNANVTAVAGPTSNTTALGSGTVTLNGGILKLAGQQSTSGSAVQQTVGITAASFNADTILDAAATSGTASSTGVTTGTIDGGNLFFESGYKGVTADSLPKGGLVTSLTTGNKFQFQVDSNGNYTPNNTVQFLSASTSVGDTLTLTTPAEFQTLDLLATGQGACTYDVKINTNNGTFDIGTFSTADWYGGNSAIKTLNPVQRSTGNVQNYGGALTMAEADFNLSSYVNDTIDSITIYATAVPNHSADIYAVSGQEFGSAVTYSSQTYSNNVTVNANSDIDVSGSLAATMGNLSIGTETLAVTSADTSGSAYSLTLGTATLTGNSTFNIAASTSSGAGTLILGPLADGGTARTISINPTGTGTLMLGTAASSLVTGTVINLKGGTLNSSVAGAIGSTASVDITNNGTFDIGAATTVSALNGTTGNVALGGNNLTIGSTDNLSSSYSGLITGSGMVVATGTGTVTLGGASTYSGASFNNNGQHIVTSLEVYNGNAIIAGPSTGSAGAVTTGPGGIATIDIGASPSTGTAEILLDNTPGRTLYNNITAGSQGSGTTTLGGLNTSGVTTFAGNVTLGSGTTGDNGHNITVAATAGGEVDFTGNILANDGATDTAVKVVNLTGSGAATVKFTGNNTYAGGTTVNPNVTLAAGLSTSLTTLGTGAVTLAGGNLSLRGQLPSGTQETVAISGYGADTILDSAATNGSASSTGTPTSTVDANSLYFENGYQGSNNGLPTSGTITSVSTNHVFQLAPYTGENTFQFTSASTSTGQTIALTTPTAFQALDFLVSAQGAGPDTLKFVLNFSNNTTANLGSFNVSDWYNGNPSNNATLNNLYTAEHANATVDPSQVTLQEYDLTVPVIDQSLTISSIEVLATALNGNSSEVYAVSGATYVPQTALATQTYNNNVNVSSSADIDVSGSLNAVVGNMTIGGNTLTLSSIDTSGSAYSLTAGTVTFEASSAQFTVNNSTGSGVGSLIVGPLNDQGNRQTITKAGPGIMTLTADSIANDSNPGLVNGTIVNITGGTLNSNSGNALGTFAAVNVQSGATFGVGASQTIGSLADLGTPVVNGSTVKISGSTLTVGTITDASSTYSGSIVDGASAGALQKSGNGTLTLLGASTYSGGTSVGFGTLLIENTSGSGTGSGPVSVTSGAQSFLGGTGTISGAVTVNGNSNIFAGTEFNTTSEVASVLGIGTNSSLTGNTILDITGVNTADELKIGGGTGAVTLGGILDVNNPNSVTFAIGQKYTLLDFGTLSSGSFGTLNLPTLPSNLAWDTSNLYTPGSSGGYIDIIAGMTGPLTLLWNNSLSSTGDGQTWDEGSEGTSQNWENGSSPSNFASGDGALFNDNNNGHYLVNLTSNVLPSSITVNSTSTYTIESTGGYVIGDYTSPATLSQSGGGTLNITNLNTFTGATTVTGTGTHLHLADTGQLASATLSVGSGASAEIDGVLSGTPVVIANGNITFGAPDANNNPSDTTMVRSLISLTIGSGATVQLAKSTVPVGQVLSLSSLTDGGTLDLTNNTVIINYGSGPDPINSIAALVASGYSGGTWTGTGIISSLAQTNHSYGIGYADYAGGNPAGLSSGQIELTYTLLGDANLDYKVNGSDFTLMAANFNDSVTAGWDKGDFNYSNTVNGDDFVLLADNFNQFASQSAVTAADLQALESFASANGISLDLTSVPEPASAGLLVAAGLGILSKRRRKA